MSDHATNDDDLPVLTHVLRTSDGRMPLPLKSPLDDLFRDFDIHQYDDPPVTPQIIIGNEPELPVTGHALAPFDDALIDAATGDPDIVADPRQTVGHDAFQLSQDADALHDGVAATIDEPELLAANDGAPPETPDVDRPLDFATPAVDPAALAARVRESVFNDLSARIDTELDARIAQTMHAEVETALAQLQRNLRVQLSEALRDVVGRAVDEEIARMNWSASNRRPD
jgi:hypothetical protein